MCDTDDLAPLNTFGHVMPGTRRGTVVDRWECPGCERIVEIVHRPGRPRIYCSHACRQRVYRWRRQHRAHTVASPAWPAEAASALSSRPTRHALRSDADPLSRRRDRRGRELTACGLLARPAAQFRRSGLKRPFLLGDGACRVCTALVAPRPLGLVPPGAMPPPVDPDATPVAAEVTIERLRAIDEAWPLDPTIRRLLTTLWRPREPASSRPAPTRPTGTGRASQAA